MATTMTTTTTTTPAPPNGAAKKEKAMDSSPPSPTISSLINAPGAHVPEDKVQYYVQTPYGRGLTVRTRKQPDNNQAPMREIELVDWKKAAESSTTSDAEGDDDKENQRPSNVAASIQAAAKSSSPRRTTSFQRPTTLYSCETYPSIPPQVGDDVMTQFGRGLVQEIRKDDGICVVLISSWRLAHRSRVTCYLQSAALQVVRSKKLYEMTVYEKVEHASTLKQQATTHFTQKRYSQALTLYASAIDAVRYVQHNAQSDNVVRADLLVLMITCSNNAGTCCTHLPGKWHEAASFCQNALALLEALQKSSTSGSSRIHAILQRDHHLSRVKLFGQWKVKSYLVQAKAQLALGNIDEALDTCKRAHEVIQQYTSASNGSNSNKEEVDAAAVQQLLQTDKQVKALHVQCKEKKRLQLKKEKMRAQAMFGGASKSKTTASTSDAKQQSSNSKLNGVAASPKQQDATSPEKGVATLADTEAADAEPVVPQVGEPEDEAAAAATLPAQRRVSFSSKVQHYEYGEEPTFDEDEVAWYQDSDFLVGLTVFATAAVVAAVATGWAMGGPRGPQRR